MTERKGEIMDTKERYIVLLTHCDESGFWISTKTVQNGVIIGAELSYHLPYIKCFHSLEDAVVACGKIPAAVKREIYCLQLVGQSKVF